MFYFIKKDRSDEATGLKFKALTYDCVTSIERESNRYEMLTHSYILRDGLSSYPLLVHIF